MTDPAPTFAEAADKVSALRAQRFADQTVKRRRRSLAIHVDPHIGNLRVSDIQPRDLLGVRETLWTQAPRSVDRVRHLIAHVMAWAAACGFSPDNAWGANPGCRHAAATVTRPTPRRITVREGARRHREGSRRQRVDWHPSTVRIPGLHHRAAR